MGRIKSIKKIESTEAELQAFNKVVEALGSLRDDARHRVVSAALTLLATSPGSTGYGRAQRASVATAAVVRPEAAADVAPAPTAVRDIRSFKEQKEPRSAIEMATLVAFYLSEIAPESERKDDIDRRDVQTYFKQAAFRMPRDANQTLVNAKNAGYLDAAGPGRYRLNAVGYNVIAHGLPRRERGASTIAPPKLPKRRSGAKKKSGGSARRARGRK